MYFQLWHINFFYQPTLFRIKNQSEKVISRDPNSMPTLNHLFINAFAWEEFKLLSVVTRLHAHNLCAPNYVTYYVIPNTFPLLAACLQAKTRKFHRQ